jgi:hypothetical protein
MLTPLSSSHVRPEASDVRHISTRARRSTALLNGELCAFDDDAGADDFARTTVATLATTIHTPNTHIDDVLRRALTARARPRVPSRAGTRLRPRPSSLPHRDDPVVVVVVVVIARVSSLAPITPSRLYRRSNASSSSSPPRVTNASSSVVIRRPSSSLQWAPRATSKGHSHGGGGFTGHDSSIDRKVGRSPFRRLRKDTG